MMNEVNRLFVVIVVLFLTFGAVLHFEIQSLKTYTADNTKEIRELIHKTNKKIDYRYFNMTKSLEEIHNVKINSKTGELK